MLQSWSSLVKGGKGSYLPNCKTNLVIALYTLSLLFFKFTTAYHLGRYEPSSPVICRAPRFNKRHRINDVHDHQPLFHADDLVPREAPHLQLPVQIPDGERDQVLVGDSALDVVW